MMTSLGVLLLVASSVGSLTDTPRAARHLFYNTEDLHEDKELHQSEVLFTTPDYARKYGYPLETHSVTTEDGYLLTLHRIPGSPKASSLAVKTPVFLQHGIGLASDCWLLTGPEKGLGFLLADQGYDVWMGNARGNRYSRGHVTISPGDVGYYNFTWHQMGVFDLPAEIDHALKVTGQQQLLYVGHSMGCTMFFVMTSTRPEYNHKIRLMVAMAPAVYLGGMRSIVKVLLPFVNVIHRGFRDAEEGQIRVANQPSSQLIQALCSDGKPLQQICTAVYFSVVGFNRKELNTTVLPSILSHALTGYTVQLLAHFAQLISTDRFQLYHRKGRVSIRHPEYDLSRVTAPVAIFYSTGDFLMSRRGVIKLSQTLPNVIKTVPHVDESWNHMDYAWAIHAKDLVYPEVMDLLRKYAHVE